ncbi:OmpA family protein [Isoptericola sp. 4D.3]|uniref:OmpA family protein n=1 Tax=Isoptericola peretonis TaxID=2918523 RepID=A0ABT0IZ33_9MICO|nr:OmpA family protein [Isoptericola sp. 4D.3]
MSVRGAAGLLAASLALVVAAAVPAGAATDPSGSPSTDGAPADAALMQEAEEALRADHARVEGAQLTAEMTADATFSLRADDPTFALRPEDSTITLEKTQETKDDTVVTLTSDLLFEFGKAALTPEAKAAVAELAADVPQDATVRVDGYTDSIGTDAKNLTLSRQRAKAVADVLGSERSDLILETKGHGEADPVAENEVGGEDNPAGRALNRRVEVTYPTS